MYWARLKNEFQAADKQMEGKYSSRAENNRSRSSTADTRPSRRLSGLYRLCVVFCSVIQAVRLASH